MFSSLSEQPKPHYSRSDQLSMTNQQHAGPLVHSQEVPPSGRHGDDDDGARLASTPAAHGGPTANVAGAYSSSILSGPASGTSAAMAAGPVELGQQQSTVPGDQALALARTTQDIERRLSVIEDVMRASPTNNAIDPRLQPPPPPAPSSETVLDPLLPQNHPPLAPPAARQQQPLPSTPRPPSNAAIPVFEGDDIVRIITPSTSNHCSSFPPPPSLAVRSSSASVPADHHLTLEEKLERDKQVLEAERTHWLELMNLSDGGNTPDDGGALLPPPVPVPVLPHPSASAPAAAAAAARNPVLLLAGGLEFVNDDRNRELLRQLIVAQREQNRQVMELVRNPADLVVPSSLRTIPPFLPWEEPYLERLLPPPQQENQDQNRKPAPPPPPYQSPYTYNKEGLRSKMQKMADQQKMLQLQKEKVLQQQQNVLLSDLDQREKVLDQYEMLVDQQEELLNQYEMLVDQDPDQPLPSVEQQQQGPAKGGNEKGGERGKDILKKEAGKKGKGKEKEKKEATKKRKTDGTIKAGE